MGTFLSIENEMPIFIEDYDASEKMSQNVTLFRRFRSKHDVRLSCDQL